MGSYKNFDGATDLSKFIFQPHTSKYCRLEEGSSCQLNVKPQQGMSEGCVLGRQLQALSLLGADHRPCCSSTVSMDLGPTVRYSVFTITLMGVTFSGSELVHVPPLWSADRTKLHLPTTYKDTYPVIHDPTVFLWNRDVRSQPNKTLKPQTNFQNISSQ